VHQPGDLYVGSDLWPCFVYFPAVGFAVGQLCQCRQKEIISHTDTQTTNTVVKASYS